MFTVSFLLLVIVMSARFVKYLAEAAAGDLAPEVVFAIIAYRIPSFLELVLSLGLFIGILLAYGRLYVESEMTVMSACGLSTRRLASYTLIPSLLVALVVALISFYGTPAGLSKVQSIFQDVKNTSGLETLVAGRFRVDQTSGRVSYVERLSDDRQTMENVFTAQVAGADSGAQLSATFAETAHIEYRPDYDGNYLVLENGQQTLGKPGERSLRITTFAEFGQLLEPSKGSEKERIKVEAKATSQLINSTALEDQAALQWRISLVLLVPVLTLIAQALSKTDHRRGRYVKMLPAFLIYMLYLVMLTAAKDAVAGGTLAPALGLWWVHGLFLLLALLLLFGADGLRSVRNVITSR